MNLKSVFIFLSGVAVGVTSAYLYLNNRLKKEYDLRLTEELLKDDNESVEKNDIHDLREEVGKDEETKDVAKEYTDYVHLTKDYSKEEMTVEDYERYLGDPDAPEFADVDVYKKIREHKASPIPYLITEEEHYETKTAYDCIFCEWDPNTMSLTDNDGNEIDDVDLTCGYDNLKKLTTGESADVFIRNESLATDYEVTLKDPRY